MSYFGSAILHHVTEQGKPAEYTEGNNERDHKIQNDIRLIGLACLAVVLGAAILTLNMSEHGRAKRAAPPGITNFFGITLSAIGTGGILDWF